MKPLKIKELSFYQVIKYIFVLVFLYIAIALLVFEPFLAYKCKKSFILPNVILLLLDGVLFVILFSLYKKHKENIMGFLTGKETTIVWIGTILLFLCQVLVSYNIYFITGWDVGRCIIPTAKCMVSGSALEPFMTDYFSNNPNNTTLVWIYSIIYKLSDFVHVNGLFSIIILNCLISCLTGFLTYQCAATLLDKKWALFSWVIYALLVGTSPWVVITYSDSFVLFIPVLIFFVYTRSWKGHYTILKWFLIGVLSFIGYHLKPQVIIIFISITVIEIWRFISNLKSKKKGRFLILGSLLLSFVISSVFSAFVNSKFDLDQEKALGFTHFAMMGLNTASDGIFNDDDYYYTVSFPTVSERTKANLEVIKQRLDSFTIRSFAGFVTRKTLVNYGDGTFAWSEEGSFYKQLFDDKNQWLSPFLKSFFYKYGSNYRKTSTFQQMIWTAVIISLLGIAFLKKNRINHTVAVLLLAILGLTAFEMIFEARARYLYCYAPVFICLSTIGLRNILFKFSNYIDRRSLLRKHA